MKRTLFDTEHEDFRYSAREFLTREVVPHHGEWSRRGRVSPDLFRSCGDLGLFGFVPEEYGGTGIFDYRFTVILAEEAARAAVVPAMLGPFLQSDVCIPYILGFGDTAQRQRWLPGLASGELIAAVAMTEPGTGSDLSGIRTRARRDGDTYVLDGIKTFITNGVNADIVIVAARTDDHPHRGLSLFVVDRDTPGFTRSEPLHKIGLHAQDTAELFFTEARVPAVNLLGEENNGFGYLSHNLASERLSTSILATAMSRAALEWTIDYVRQRKTFGHPLGSRQHTRFRLAELSTELEVTQQFVDSCVLAQNAGELTPVDAAMAKWWTTELQGRVIDACLQLHGGYGYMAEYPVARAWTDARVFRIFAGATEIMKEIVGRSLNLEHEG